MKSRFTTSSTTTGSGRVNPNALATIQNNSSISVINSNNNASNTSVLQLSSNRSSRIRLLNIVTKQNQLQASPSSVQSNVAASRQNAPNADSSTAAAHTWVASLTAALASCMKTLSSPTVQLAARRDSAQSLVASLTVAKCAVERSPLANHSDVVVSLENIVPLLNFQILKVGIISISGDTTNNINNNNNHSTLSIPQTPPTAAPMTTSTNTNTIRQRQQRDEFLFLCCSALKLIAEMLGPLLSFKTSVAVATTLVDVLLLVFGLPVLEENKNNNKNTSSMQYYYYEYLMNLFGGGSGNHNSHSGSGEDVETLLDVFLRPVAAWEATAMDCLAAVSRSLETPVAMLPHIIAHFLRAVDALMKIFTPFTTTTTSPSNNSNFAFMTKQQLQVKKSTAASLHLWTVDRRFQFVADLVLTLLEDAASSNQSPSYNSNNNNNNINNNSSVIERAYAILPSTGMRMANPFIIPYGLYNVHNQDDDQQQHVQFMLQDFFAKALPLYGGSSDDVVIATMTQLMNPHQQQQQQQQQKRHMSNDNDNHHMDEAHGQHLREYHQEQVILNNSNNINNKRNRSNSQVSIESETTLGDHDNDGDEDDEFGNKGATANKIRSNTSSVEPHQINNSHLDTTNQQQQQQNQQSQSQSQSHQQQQQTHHLLDSLQWYYLDVNYCSVIHSTNTASTRTGLVASAASRPSSLRPGVSMSMPRSNANSRSVSIAPGAPHHGVGMTSPHFRRTDALTLLWHFFVNLTSTSVSSTSSNGNSNNGLSSASKSIHSVTTNPSSTPNSPALFDLQVRALALVYTFYPHDVGSALVRDHWHGVVVNNGVTNNNDSSSSIDASNAFGDGLPAAEQPHSIYNNTFLAAAAEDGSVAAPAASYLLRVDVATKRRVIAQLCSSPPYAMMVAHPALMSQPIWEKYSASRRRDHNNTTMTYDEESDSSNGDYYYHQHRDEDFVVVIGSMTLVPIS